MQLWWSERVSTAYSVICFYYCNIIYIIYIYVYMYMLYFVMVSLNIIYMNRYFTTKTMPFITLLRRN